MARGRWARDGDRPSRGARGARHRRDDPSRRRTWISRDDDPTSSSSRCSSRSARPRARRRRPTRIRPRSSGAWPPSRRGRGRRDDGRGERRRHPVRTLPIADDFAADSETRFSSVRVTVCPEWRPFRPGGRPPSKSRSPSRSRQRQARLGPDPGHAHPIRQGGSVGRGPGKRQQRARRSRRRDEQTSRETSTRICRPGLDGRTVESNLLRGDRGGTEGARGRPDAPPLGTRGSEHDCRAGLRARVQPEPFGATAGPAGGQQRSDAPPHDARHQRSTAHHRGLGSQT